MKVYLRVILMLSFGLACAWAQNFIEVWPGEGTLSAALANVQDGDVLVLSSGQEYTESTLNYLGTIAGKNVRITTDYEDRAIVRMTKIQHVDSTGYFFRIGDQGSLKLENIEFDGTGNAKYFINFYMPVEFTPTIIKKIHLENCFVHDVRGDVLHGEKSSGIAGYLIFDSTIVNNCLFYRTGPVIHYKQAASNYVSLTNSTIAEITSYGIRLCGPGYTTLPDNTPEVIIDHTTWYRIGTSDVREIILGEQPPLVRPWKVTNSIFVEQLSRNGGTRKTCVNIKSSASTGESNVATITNCLFWNVDQLKFYSHTVRDTIKWDPGFVAPNDYDFTLANNSIAYHIAGDGSKAIGDLRWATATNLTHPPLNKLNISVTGQGTVEFTPQPLIINFYQPGTVVNLVALPESLYCFDSWSGDLTGTDSVAVITMDSDKQIVANFRLKAVSIASEALPKSYHLGQNHPNPFNATTVIPFSLKQAGLTRLSIYNLMGKEVLRLVDQPLAAGNYQYTVSMEHLASGVYFYKLTAGDFTAVKKLVLMK